MPRLERLDYKDAIHCVSVHGRVGSYIFFDPQVLRQLPQSPREGAPRVLGFQSLLADVCKECGTLLHAYCLEPNSGILVLRASGAPLHRFMQGLGGGYSRYLRDRGFEVGKGAFQGRYDSKVIAPEYLPHAVRRAHRSPIVNGLCRRRLDYPFSSERTYTGEPSAVFLESGELKAALEHRGLFGLRGYREFMDQPETPYVERLLSQGSPLDSRIVGDKAFVQTARYLAAHPPAPPTRQELIEAIAKVLDQTPADIEAGTHTGTLGRALVAWYGQRMGAATLTEMGRWFLLTGAALGQAIRHYRDMRPELFDLAALPGIETDKSG